MNAIKFVLGMFEDKKPEPEKKPETKPATKKRRNYKRKERK